MNVPPPSASLFLSARGPEHSEVFYARIDFTEARLRHVLALMDTMRDKQGELPAYVAYADWAVEFRDYPMPVGDCDRDARLVDQVPEGPQFLDPEDVESNLLRAERTVLCVRDDCVWWEDKSARMLFETDHVSRSLLAAALLYVVPSDEIEATLKEALAECDVTDLLDVLESGLFPPAPGQARPPRAHIDPELLAPLLQSEDRDIRQRAIIVMPTLAAPGSARAPAPQAARRRGP